MEISPGNRLKFHGKNFFLVDPMLEKCFNLKYLEKINLSRSSNRHCYAGLIRGRVTRTCYLVVTLTRSGEDKAK